MINFRLIVNLMGKLLLAETIFLFASLLVAIFYQDQAISSFAITLAVTLTAAGAMIAFGRQGKNLLDETDDINKKDGFIIVSLVWVVFSIFGCLPFILSGSIPSITDAYFETVSGFTTTGSSILNNIEELPKSILFWRSLTQWIGGMGIIVLFLAILPKLGVGGRELFMAEVPGPIQDKIKPRIRATAQKLWMTYILLTFLEVGFLYFGGMDGFDAINHAFTTVSTGGYSTKQASIAAFNSAYIEYVIIVFMLLSGINFSLLYLAFHGDFKTAFKDEELRWYIGFIAIFALLITVELSNSHFGELSDNIRNALFSVATLITTTGYANIDFLLFPPYTVVLLFALFFFGGSGGSTSGGIKIVRLVIMIKNSYYELFREVNPSVFLPVRYNHKPVNPTIVTSITSFLVMYMLVFALSVMIVSFWLPNLEEALSAVATALGNIGPGLGAIGPDSNFSAIPDPAKWFLSFLMILGRLELFTVLVLLNPRFWR